MAKKRKSDEITEERLFWFMTTAYILRAVNLLADGKEAKLDSLGDGDWKDHVRQQLGVDDAFIRSVFALCTEYRDKRQAVAFLLRGFGCPDTDERLSEFSELRST